jgi:glycosyltransferase involved in cell wall biosynthesis
MSLNRLYYSVKPFMPWRLRVAARRVRAKSRRVAYADVWPIDPKAGTTPPGWPGWPGGKRFALVFSHDVEGKKGFDRVERLMALEAKYRFRSSFNFVPRGEYCLTVDLREKMERAGFEVGVHGLEHDGKLYSSKAAFAERAGRIREYAREWNASGFRSPLMQHKLAWLHELGLEYDASTFDTDPFEPEPDGVGTIFPFWVPGPNGTGYVELPYTLAQDFTMFVVLREKNIDIWKQKLDWVVKHGGMALLNTHPDYMSFGGASPARDEFPVSHYEELLRYARDKYEGMFWTGTPREVARFYCTNVPLSSRNSRKKICMLTHSTYDNDNRVRRYAESLARRGDQVDVIALSGGCVPLGTEEINGVTVHRVQQRERNERSRWTYAWRMIRFFLVSSFFLTRRHRRVRYDLIHVHNVPDVLVFAAWYPKWTGAGLILDIHDILPELFASKFKAKKNDGYVGLLKIMEKASATFADHVIVSNDIWHETLISRAVSSAKCSVFLNHVDSAIFFRRPRTREDGKLLILFLGSFHWHQGLDIAINAFARLKDKVPNAEFHIYGGGGDRESDLIQLIEDYKLEGRVKFCGSLSLEKIADVISTADLGVVPKRANSFGNEAYSTKIMEFMSQGVPVVASRTKIDSLYFDDSMVRFFRSEDVQCMADAMLEVIQNAPLRESLVAAGYKYVECNGWDTRRGAYLDLVDGLSTGVFDSPEPARSVVELG